MAQFNPCGGKDVALLAVGVEEQGQTGVAMGVVVDGGHLRNYAVLVAAEVDDAVKALVATTAVAAGDHAAVVAALAAVFGDNQAPLAAAASDF